MNICVNWNIVHCWQACYCWNHWLCSTFSWRYCLHWASWGWKWDQRWVYLCFVYDYEGIRSLLLSLWRLLRMLSVLLLARLLKWTLYCFIWVYLMTRLFLRLLLLWTSLLWRRVGSWSLRWVFVLCVLMVSCLILMSWRDWWIRLLMISSVRRLSINCCCWLMIGVCLFLLMMYCLLCYIVYYVSS